MKKKSKATAAGKKTVSRMFDLEVDEVSAVDKPAIGEEFIVTKSVNGKGETVAKKNVKKTEKDPKAGAEADDTAKAGAVGEGGESTEADEADDTAESTEDEGAEDGTDEDSDAEGDGEQAGGESAEADQSKAVEGRVVGLEKSEKEIRKDMIELQETLGGVLELHEMAAGALNTMVALTFSAFEMCASMSDVAAGDTEMSEAHTKALADIKKSLGDAKEEVQKAGAKISSSRLAVLQEIATKLSSLLAEVQAAAKEGKKGGKKKSEEMEAVEKRATDLEALLKANAEELKTAKEDVTKLANRLNELETSAGASSAVEEDEDDSDSSSRQTQSKSVFAGLIPVDEIKKQQSERAVFLKRQNGGKEVAKKD